MHFRPHGTAPHGTKYSEEFKRSFVKRLVTLLKVGANSLADFDPVYTILFSFHIRLEFCLNNAVSPCTAIVSLCAFSMYCTFCAAPQMNGRLVELIMRFRIELTSDSTVFTVSGWFNATLRMCSFENAKTV